MLEGVEGAGKSTQARLLAEWLGREGVAFLHTREPGGTPLGEEVRRLVLHGDEMPARSELLLYLAARAALVERVIRPALAEGRVVIADRFGLSTLAYQGYGRDLPRQSVRAIHDFATGGLSPDLTIVLDVPVTVGVARREAGRAADRIERAGAGFHDRVAEAYRLLAKTEDGVETVDGTATAQAVHGSIVALLKTRFPETFGATTG
ncbi:MAG: dTMP kinase [Longimicrobiales bacterium]